MNTLSIIIVTYNPGKILDTCLGSIADTPYELIVVDNQSTDGTPDRIRDRYPQIKLIISEENGGFSNGNNQGLRVANGNYLLLLNPDVIITPQAIDDLIDIMEKNPNVGIAGCRTFDSFGNIALTAYGDYTPFKILWQYWGLSTLFRNRAFEEYRLRCKKTMTPFYCSWVQGHCMMIRRDVYDQIGGLDNGLFMFAEEPDYCERSRENGWDVMFTPVPDVTHHESSTVSRYPLLKMRHYHLSPLYYFRKRNLTSAVRILKIGFLLELSVKWFIRFVQYSIRHDSSLKSKFEAYPIVIREVWEY
jgi:N-acetylglucosaminyl-diphospho-decaprenol L-rhamnosyltransferase